MPLENDTNKTVLAPEEPGLEKHQLPIWPQLPEPCKDFQLTSESDRLLTPARVAEICETKVATVWGWCRSGRLEHIRLSARAYRVKQSALYEFFMKATR